MRKKRDNLLEALVENSSDILMIVELDGIVDYASPSIEQVLGYGQREVVGTNAFDYIHPDDLTQSLEELAKTVQQPPGYRARSIQRTRHKDGSWRWIESTGCLVHNGSETSAIATSCRDVTERKMAEEELRDSEGKYRATVEQSADSIFLVDPETRRVLESNAALQRLLGYFGEELKGIVLDDFVAHPREDIDRNIEMILTKGSVFLGERVYRCRDGSTVDVEVSASCIPFRGKEVLSVVSRDITERKQMEGELRRAHNDLERRVEERISELAKANKDLRDEITQRKRAEKELEASLQEKEVLLREVHHRVKNNLQVISSLLNLQSKHVEDQHALSLFKETRNRVISIATLHERLYLSEDLANIDFAEYVERTVAQLFDCYDENPVHIEVITDMENVRLPIDTAIPCGLIVNELVSNCLKHAFPNGKRGKISIDMHSDNRGNYTVTIRDDGVGFPQDLDFENAESLGMQLVVALTRQLEGTIELDITKGTAFKITFARPKLRGRRGRRRDICSDKPMRTVSSATSHPFPEAQPPPYP